MPTLKVFRQAAKPPNIMPGAGGFPSTMGRSNHNWTDRVER